MRITWNTARDFLIATRCPHMTVGSSFHGCMWLARQTRTVQYNQLLFPDNWLYFNLGFRARNPLFPYGRLRKRRHTHRSWYLRTACRKSLAWLLQGKDWRTYNCHNTWRKRWWWWWCMSNAVGWGTALRVGRKRVRFPMGVTGIFHWLVRTVALWPWDRPSL